MGTRAADNSLRDLLFPYELNPLAGNASCNSGKQFTFAGNVNV